MEYKLKNAFNKACVKYGLIKDGDKILVGVSGGKDSLILLELLALRSRIHRPQFNIEAIHVTMENIPYSTDLIFLKNFCDNLNVPLHVIKSSFNDKGEKSICFLCSWNRRKTIFGFAENNGFTKVALGHHQDDIITTYIMNMSFTGSQETILPLMELKHYNISLIRPLCLIKEDDIREYALKKQWKGMLKRCPFENITQREKISKILDDLLGLNPVVRSNIWRCITKESES